jgi:2,5-diketo-D-gluconate reductase A
MRDGTTMQLTKAIEIPTVGFGTYLIPHDDAAAAVRQALEAGYRHLDTAEF